MCFRICKKREMIANLEVFLPLLLVLGVLCVGSSTACKHNGVDYRNGEEWEERSAFVMRCTIYENGSWKTEVVACVLPNHGRRIPINTSVEDHNDE
uniref:Secreted protein n=1 Tax=Ditylenchus dipsaci TaxID=166011 RepID=A0A915D5T5_9BILA